jgi:hypothetical protein
MNQGKHRELFGYEDIAGTFKYDPLTGELWRRLPDGRMRQLRGAWERPNRGSDLATSVSFRGYRIRSTHIMFMLHERQWPKERYHMDHRDGDCFNNRWSNLREANHSQSMANREPPGRWSSEDNDLERGVYSHYIGYQVRISVNGKERCFGTFVTKEEANSVARKARAELHGDYLYEASRKPKGLRRI